MFGKVDGGRKYKIALFLLALSEVNLVGGFIGEKSWMLLVLAVAGGYGLVNAGQKIWRK